MADYFFTGQIPNYTFDTKNIKIDPETNSIIISDSSINKVLNINSQQLSNNTGQSLLFSDIYTTVNKTPSITYPPTNSTTLNVNNTITLTDGITTNTLNQSDWTGFIKTVNTSSADTHYLNFSDSSATGQGHPQKTALLSVNPSLGTITCNALNGVASSALTSNAITTTTDNTNGSYFIPFSKTPATNSSALFIDDTTGPLTYNPSTSSLSCTTFAGNALTASTSAAVRTTTDNTSGTYYIPFSKTTANNSTSLFVDDTTGPLSYNPATSTLSCSLINTRLVQPTTQNTATYVSPTLSISGSSVTLQNSSILFSGSTNTISALTLTNMIVGGEYRIGIFNGGSGNLTINTSLGTNIKTIHSSGVNISGGTYGLMTINVLTINELTIYIVEVVKLTN